jgi:hypothetical protein
MKINLLLEQSRITKLLKTREEVLEFLEEAFSIFEDDVEINDELEVTVNGDITSRRSVNALIVNGTFPIRIKEVFGDVHLSDMNLKSLDWIYGKITGSVHCKNLDITDLSGIGEIHGELVLTQCKNLTSFKGLNPDSKIHNVKIKDCENLSSLEGLPESISGSLILNNCAISSFSWAPKEIGKLLRLENCDVLSSLADIRRNVKRIGSGEVYISRCRKLKAGILSALMIKGVHSIKSADAGNSLLHKAITLIQSMQAEGANLLEIQNALLDDDDLYTFGEEI